jgi:serine/threonine protein kinase
VTAAVTHNTSNLAPGYKLDRYELLCPIAEGGMASVWVARQRGKHGFEKLVAIKTILPIFASDIRFQAMFLDEARIASKIEHLNVAQILDLGEEHDVLYLAMEYVDGDALSKLNRACQKKGVKIPVGVLLRVLADTCSGLHEAHELKDNGRTLEIVHRDVSPHNILVSTKGIAKLIDFGIAKARSRVGNDTNSGVLKGKIQYMAPEQALGRPVDRRADIWAVGAILYHLIAGKPPYEGDNQLATLHLLGSGRPPVPLPPGVHPAISAIVRKALSHAPEGRYETASSLHDALEDAIVQAKVPTTPADVAAFSALHMSERADRRRQSIDIALAAAAERHRVEDLLRPTSERSSVTSATPVSGARHLAPPSSGALGAVAPEGMTLPEVPVAKGGLDAVAKLTARVSEVPPNSRSYATLGSAALDASTPSLPQPASRKGLVAAVVLVAIVAIAATGVSFTVLRTRGVAPAARPAAEGTALATATAGSPAATASAAPTDSPASSGPAGIPTYAASSLPRAVPKVPAWTPPARWTPPPTPPAAAQTPPTTTRPKKVDDGF